MFWHERIYYKPAPNITKAILSNAPDCTTVAQTNIVLGFDFAENIINILCYKQVIFISIDDRIFFYWWKYMPTQVSWWKSIFQPKHQYSRFLILSNASHSSILLSEPFPHLSASSVNFHWKEEQNRKEYTFAPPSICQGILKTCTNLEIFLYLFLIIILIYTWQSLSVRVDSTVVPLFTKSSRQQDPKKYILWCWDEGPCLC